MILVMFITGSIETSRHIGSYDITCDSMKELLRSTDPTTIAFASALLGGEGIDCFQMDVNMSILEGALEFFPDD